MIDISKNIFILIKLVLIGNFSFYLPNSFVNASSRSINELLQVMQNYIPSKRHIYFLVQLLNFISSYQHIKRVFPTDFIRQKPDEEIMFTQVDIKHSNVEFAFCKM